jgi:hypothetical protein
MGVKRRRRKSKDMPVWVFILKGALVALHGTYAKEEEEMGLQSSIKPFLHRG